MGDERASSPAHISLPESWGSGYDQSAFEVSKGKGCTFCHTAHGSPNPTLLKMEKTRSSHWKE
ncbi:MAG: hypothetical protein KJ645_13975 [Planctomycetes bacterium]|nr:hypothetical protein [Planctomycetota bacterium]